MNWFKCDDSGNILIDMHSILDLLQNIAIPQLGTKQNEILEAIQRIPVSDGEEGSGGISASQLGEILQAIDNIPSQELLDNQAELLAKLTDNSTKLGNIESTVNDIKTTSLPEIKGNQTTVLNKITDNTDKLSNMNTMLDTIYSSLEYSVEGVLRTGETSITLEDEHIKEGISVEIYTSVYNVGPLSIEPIDGSITLTFPEQEEDMGVKVVFKRHIDWSNINSDGIDTSDATATDSDLLAGKTAYVNDEKITGTIPVISAINETLDCGNMYTIPRGYHDGTGTVTAIISDSGYVTRIDGNIQNRDVSLITNGYANVSISTLPRLHSSGSAIVYNNEIHILRDTYHYKYTNSQWVNVSTLPYNFCYNGAVVYNNEIHILGSNTNSDATKHYKYDGSTWSEVSTLPYNFGVGGGGNAIVFNNEIHILGTNDGGNRSKHYKYDGSTWSEVSILPYETYGSGVVVLDNEIHLVNGTKHYKYDGSTWSEVSTLPYNFNTENAVVLNNEIHILKSSDLNGHYKWDGETWSNIGTLPYGLSCSSAVVIDDCIHVLGGNNPGTFDKHYGIMVPLYTKSYS